MISPESFEAWASARQHGLLRAAYLLTGDLGRAEDLVQEALLKVALRWRRLGGPRPDAYVRVILYRDQVSWWRRRHTANLRRTTGLSKWSPTRT